MPFSTGVERFPSLMKHWQSSSLLPSLIHSQTTRLDFFTPPDFLPAAESISSPPCRQPNGRILWVADQRWEGTIMDWHHILRMQELHSLGRVFRPHYEMFADRQESEIDRHIFGDQLHIGEKCRIPCVKDRLIL